MTITPMMQYIQDKVYTIVFNNWVPISQEISMRDTKYYYPISLSRVLTALGDEYHRGKIKDHYWERIWIIHTSQYWAVICSARRKLLNEDKSEASLFDQSQDTITAIWVLLWYKDE